MKFPCCVALSLVAVSIAACSGGSTSTPVTKRLSIATGGTGGVFYPYGGGIAKVISENLPGVEATAEVTAASVDNLMFIKQGTSEVAFTMADTAQDVAPSGYDALHSPVHGVGIVAMGLWLLDNCDLEACAATAAELGQWDFHLAVAPVRFAGTSGSPVNPIATF